MAGSFTGSIPSLSAMHISLSRRSEETEIRIALQQVEQARVSRQRSAAGARGTRAGAAANGFGDDQFLPERVRRHLRLFADGIGGGALCPDLVTAAGVVERWRQNQ